LIFARAATTGIGHSSLAEWADVALFAALNHEIPQKVRHE
jgi:hypothetical protein